MNRTELARISAFLQGIQRGLQAGFLIALFCYPVWAACWEVVALLNPQFSAGHPILYHVSRALDGGAQLPVSRSFFRIGLALLSVTGLMLPVGQGRGAREAWAWFALAWGLLSAAIGPCFYASETEWEFWFLLLVASRILATRPTLVSKATALVAWYIMLLAVAVHALLFGLLGSGGRLVGVFHHPNIMSTFCLMSLPFLLWRGAFAEEPDRVFAAPLSGVYLALVVWTGSLTGLSVLMATLCYWAWKPATSLRVLISALAFCLPVLANLSGGTVGPITQGVGLATLLGLCWRGAKQSGSRARASVALAAFALTILLLALLSPDLGGGGTVVSRDNSLSARLHFYRAGCSLLVQRPLLGLSPGGFAHEYPRFQGSVLYFSKFIHCLPFEFLVEWGLPAGALALVSLVVWGKSVRWEGFSVPKPVLATAFAAFVLHCLSGVQDQFPYLFAYLVLGYHLCRAERFRPERAAEGPVFALGRFALAVALLGLVLFNGIRVASQFDRSTGFELFQRRGPVAGVPSTALLSRSALSLPVDEEAWYQWGLLLDAQGQGAASTLLARRAISLDRQWAAPRELEMRNAPNIAMERVTEAIAIDPVNYPTFYRVLAELQLRQGNSRAALEQLLSRSADYSPILLSRLPEFRADDLEEQLGEYWIAVAVAAEAQGKDREAEHAFRMAMYFCHSRLARLRRLVSYPERRKIEVGPLVQSMLSQLAEQLR